MLEEKLDLFIKASEIDDKIRNKSKLVNLPLSDLVEFFSLLDTDEEKEDFLCLINQEYSEKIKSLIDGGLL